jgi:hypothetical protein
MQCPVELYNTILQCWHQNRDCRLTFEFLGDFLYDFQDAIESESHLKGNAFLLCPINNVLCQLLLFTA